ncbi:MAG: GHKL domain-containing protein [Sarcina sp.]|nr:GHKL domain-containing protein [Sarcina sp.]
MMPFTLMEAVVFNLLRAVPLLILAFYPFRGKRRFSPEVTAFFFEGILLIWMCISLVNAYFSGTTFIMALVELVGLVAIAVLYVAAINGHPGKMLFFCFLLINVGYMVSVTTKCLEGFLFPNYVMDRYRWTASLCLCIVSPLILIPVYYFMKWEKDNISQDQQPGYIWKFSWLVPTTFYLIWAHEFYGTGNSLSWCLNVFNVLFLGIVNLGSFLIYYLILRMVRDNVKYMQLREENHALTLQVMQYEDLNQRISAARQGRHDMRHHIVTMETLLNSGDLDGLRKYLADVGEKYQLDESLIFCSNTTVNGVLLYFSREAKEEGIEYKVNIGIPEDIKIAKTDLSILFGNLLENAVEACRRQTSGARKIHVRGQTRDNVLTFAIDNTYEIIPEKDKKGRFRSMKHSGAGIGTESVKNIVSRYHGVVEFETKGDLFCVSVMLYLT